MAEAIGIAKLKQRFETDDSEVQEWFAGMFPKDNVRNTRYAINFFTSIGLGPLTDDLREFLKNAPKLLIAKAKEDNELGFFARVKSWFTSEDKKEGQNKENNDSNNITTNYKTNKREISDDSNMVSNKKSSKPMIFVRQEDDEVDYMPVEFEEIKENDLVLDEAAQKFRDETIGLRGNNLKTTL